MESRHLGLRVINTFILLHLGSGAAHAQYEGLSKGNNSEKPIINQCNSKHRVNFPDHAHGSVPTVTVYGSEDPVAFASLFELQALNSTACRPDMDQEFSPDRAVFTKFGHVGRTVHDYGKTEATEILWYSVSQYCVNLVPHTFWVRSIQVLTCPLRATKSLALASKPVIKITKCCPPVYMAVKSDVSNNEDSRNVSTMGSGNSENATPGSSTCVEDGNDWKPIFYESSTLNMGACIHPAPTNTTVFQITTRPGYNQVLQSPHSFAYPRKTYSDGIQQYPGVRWRLLDNGSFVAFAPSSHRLDHGGQWIVVESVCVDWVLYGNQKIETFYSLVEEELPDSESEGENSTTVFTHHENPDENGGTGPSLKEWLYIIFIFSSLLFLIPTIIAYLLTWKQQNIHGWTVLSYLVSLLISNVFVGTAYVISFVDVYGEQRGSPGCIYTGMMAMLFLLSSYMWLTMINFDLWWTFRVLNANSTSNSLRRYSVYTVCAVGIPLLITMVGYMLDLTDDLDSDCDYVIRPHFGYSKCYMDHRAEGPYLYYPLLLILFLNSIFFVLTVLKIFNVRRSTKVTLKKRSNSGQKSSVIIFGKLFIVMGFSCITEVISWLAEGHTESNADTHWAFVILDSFNIIIRPVGLFIIFACKRSVLEQLEAQFISCGILSEKSMKTSVSQSTSNTGAKSSDTLESKARCKL